jgi:ABC-type sugar transport system ATPase subunit
VLLGIDLTVRAGEIVGIAGLVGAGRTELCRALFGVDRIDGGRIFVDGKEVRFGSPRDAVKEGVVLAPEDRQRHGLAAGRPVGENISLASLERVSPGGVIRHGRERRAVEEQVAGLRLRCESSAQPAGRLSGGTQQKAVIGKWLMRGARVYLFDEPARGIDVGAKREVFELMDKVARQGAAVVMVSSELPELIQVADRIVVMREGRIVAHCAGQSSQEEILRHATMGGAD